MSREMEKGREISEPVEILPEGIGDMLAMEAAPLLARASSRLQTLEWKGEFWDGVRQNLEGVAAWIKAEKVGLVKKTLSVVVSASFLTTVTSACANGPNTLVANRINFCGSGEPACPSDQTCLVTSSHVNPDLTVKSGICVSADYTSEPKVPVGTPSGIATEKSGSDLGRTYLEVRFDPTQPCGQAGMPECRNMMNDPGWVKNWYPDNQWPAGVIPEIVGYTYNPADGLYYPNSPESK